MTPLSVLVLPGLIRVAQAAGAEIAVEVGRVVHVDTPTRSRPRPPSCVMPSIQLIKCLPEPGRPNVPGESSSPNPAGLLFVLGPG